MRILAEAPERPAGVGLVDMHLPARQSSVCQPIRVAKPFMLMGGAGEPILPIGGGPAGILGRGQVHSAAATVGVFRQLRNGLQRLGRTPRVSPSLSNSMRSSLSLTVDTASCASPGLARSLPSCFTG